MTQPSPIGRARVRRAAGLDPAPGSVSANDDTSSPEAIRGSQRLRCSSVPKRAIGWVPSDVCAHRVIATLESTRASSSTASA
jgi:hypothetical protein